jgi:hypothetical protein
METQRLQTQIRAWLILFIIGLLISGITAFPLEWELQMLNQIVTHPALPLIRQWPALVNWLAFVNEGLQETYQQYPFMAYGTDWLAFAHIVIAVAFIGPLKDPVRNVWVIEFGMIACVLVLPLALIAGPLRGIPFFWQLVDCSFGVLGIIPLWICRNAILNLQGLESKLIQAMPA